MVKQMNSDDLIDSARTAAKNSYSPYSGFKVGAAVEMSSGKVYSGTNIENASYGLSICAERNAIFSAISAGETAIKQIAVSCQQDENSTKNSLMPCGACRQVISEFASPKTKIIVDGVGTFTLKELLPTPFKLNDLPD